MPATLLELPGPAAIGGGLWYATCASTRFGRHFHEELELNLVVRGGASYWFPHAELRIQAPSALWIPARVEHELLDATTDLSMWVYTFRTSSVAPALVKLAALDGPWVSSIDEPALAQLCALSTAGLLRPRAESFNAILARVSATAGSFEPIAVRSVDAACHPAVGKAARLLQNAGYSGSTEQLAHTCGLSRERLSRLFTQSLGIGLVHYRNHHRIQTFIHDYGDGSRGNMLRASLDVGFGSYAQFYRAFKQVTGYAPARHLERVRAGIVDPDRTGIA